MMKKIFSQKTAVSLLWMVFGTAMTAAAFGLVILPLGFSAGGVTGTAKLLANHLHISLSTLVLILNMTLLVLGFVFVGSQFVLKTVGVSVLFPLMMRGFSVIGQQYCTGLNPVVGIVLAGLLLGTGSGLILKSNSSSGGYDILALILNRKLHIPVSMVLTACDVTVILAQTTSLSIANLLCGIAVIVLSSATVEVLLQQKHVQISKNAVAVVAKS